MRPRACICGLVKPAVDDSPISTCCVRLSLAVFLGIAVSVVRKGMRRAGDRPSSAFRERLDRTQSVVPPFGVDRDRPPKYPCTYCKAAIINRLAANKPFLRFSPQALRRNYRPSRKSGPRHFLSLYSPLTLSDAPKNRLRQAKAHPRAVAGVKPHTRSFLAGADRCVKSRLFSHKFLRACSPKPVHLIALRHRQCTHGQGPRRKHASFF